MAFGVLFVAMSFSFQLSAEEVSLRQLAVNQQFAQQREVFQELRELLTRGDIEEAQQRQSELAGYPLQSYFDYLLLRKRITASNRPLELLVDIDRFHKRWSQARLQTRLLGVMKNRLAALERWRQYRKVLAIEAAPTHPCDDLYARAANGLITRLGEDSIDHWARPVVHGGNCQRAFQALTKNRPIPVAALWKRSSGLIEKGKHAEATELLRYFSQRDRKRLQDWMQAQQDPIAYLRSIGVIKDDIDRKKLLDLIGRLARQDLLQASNYVRSHGTAHGLDRGLVNDMLRRYAVRAAKSDKPDAAQLLRSIVDPDRSVRYWQIRVALRDADWAAALDAIRALPGSEGQASRWRYWRARSLQELGYQSAARRIFTELAGLVEYHGFLAADQLGSPYALFSQAPVVNNELRQGLQNDPRLQRAIEFFLVGIGWEGRLSWNKALKGSSKDEYIAAASIAASVGWHNRALAAMKAAEQPLALEHLFPTPYLKDIRALASRHSLHEELVYGVIRQESAFIPDIRSSAGAIGLMQLMPATARQMGREMGLRIQTWRLIDYELNLQLGVRYLEHVLDRFSDNPVLATAAYNAGPHRVSRWLRESTTAADVWVETIPFDETRDYVKNVLFNTIVAQWRLQNGTTNRLSSRMPDINPSS